MWEKMPCASFLFCSSNYTLSLDELEAVESKVTIEPRSQFGKTKMDATSHFFWVAFFCKTVVRVIIFGGGSI